MDVNKYTLSMIENYIEATGQDALRRSSLSPEQYLMFRLRAAEEVKQGFAGTILAPENNTVALTPKHLVNEKSAPQPLPRPIRKKETAVHPSTVSETDNFYEDDESNDALDLLKSIPG